MDSLRRDIASLEQRMRDSDRKAQEETRNRLRTMFPEEAAVPGVYAVFSLVMENAEGVFQDSLCRKVCAHGRQRHIYRPPVPGQRL